MIQGGLIRVEQPTAAATRGRDVLRISEQSYHDYRGRRSAVGNDGRDKFGNDWPISTRSQFSMKKII